MITLSAVMVGLGFWQWHRYHERHAINVRITQAKTAAPVPLESVVGPSRPLPAADEWVKVRVTGVYQSDKTIVARERTVNSSVGLEIVTPLLLSDGSVVLIDRGWIPAGSGSPTTVPALPAVPSGPVTITGRVHLPESDADRPIHLGDYLAVRRIAPATVAADLGYSTLLPDYVLADQQSPKAAGSFTKIPGDTQPAWMNAGYTVQWWCFSLLALGGYGWAARREARDRRDGIVRTPTTRASRPRDRLADLEMSGTP